MKAFALFIAECRCYLATWGDELCAREGVVIRTSKLPPFFGRR